MTHSVWNNHTGHFIEKCSECGKVTAQCRCPSSDKTEKFIVCDECNHKKELFMESLEISAEYHRKEIEKMSKIPEAYLRLGEESK